MIRLAPSIAVVCALVAFAAQASAAIWLDAPPAGWNTPGAAVPQAPPINNPDVRCRSSEVTASTPEQSMLSARGWRLQSFWPPVSSGGRVVIGALADYDGMCRPSEFNVFVFNQGQYAGTLSPDHMLPRTDGSLFIATANQVATIGASGSIAADFIRYADTDPLCCPSRGVTRVIYTVQTGGAGPVVVPSSIGASPVQAGSGGAAQVPARLPATGEIADFALPLVFLGVMIVAVGVFFRARGASSKE